MRYLLKYSNETVIAQILSSAEYFNKSPQTAVMV